MILVLAIAFIPALVFARVLDEEATRGNRGHGCARTSTKPRHSG